MTTGPVSASTRSTPTCRSRGSDEALEHAENALLAELGHEIASANERVELAAADLCRGMTPEQVAALANALRPLCFGVGSEVFAAGDHGEDMYIVTQGEVEVRLRTTQRHYKRLAKYGPGTFFGEVSFLQPGPRAATAVVLVPTELLVLDRDGLADLERERPDAAVALLIALGKMQGRYLRHSAEEIQRMAQW